ncbi:hypothetical protein HGG76_10610 [Ochrobactrum tritici]|uniref:Uncharacterized protein n=1 Tax=Brucella tritici TaxID=94626 RepID=A0A7X6FRQ4_9HYPH|nr:hypothetical protein [Brucella tritici]
MALAALLVAALLLAGGYFVGKREGRQEAVSEQLREDVKAERERGEDDEKLRGLTDYDFVLLPFVVAGCPSTGATSCAGWRQNNLSPAGLVALTKVDRPAAERVEGNDETGKRRGCWK